MRAAAVATFALAWVLLAGAPAARAGAYTLSDGEAKVFVSGLASAGDHYYDRKGRLKARARLKKQDLQIFGEYGATGALTLFAATALERISVGGADRSRRSGVGRSEFGARLKLAESNGWIVSVQSSAVVAGAGKSQKLAVVGETDDQVDMRALVARSFTAFERPAFVDVQAGYRTRSGAPADELRLDATLGIRAWPRSLVLLQSFNIVGRERWTGPFPLKQRIHKVQAGLLYDLSDAVQLYAAAFATPEARDALDERGVIVGVGYRF